MVKKKSENKLGAWTFLIGAIVAVLFGLLGMIGPGIAWFLVIVGIIVGLLNVGEDEVNSFLMSGAVLIIAAGFGQVTVSAVTIFADILNALLMIFVPATIIVAIKNVFGMARR